MSEIEGIKQKFVEHVKLRGFDDKYIDKIEEKEILQQGIDMGLAVETARIALIQTCENLTYVLESELDKKTKEFLGMYAKDGFIEKKQFQDIVSLIEKAAQGKINAAQCTAKVKTIMQDLAYKPKEGMFDKWFAKV